MNRAADQSSVFIWFPSFRSQPCYWVCLFFSTLTSTNNTRVSHQTNTTACRNSTVSPKLSHVASLFWTWAGGPMTLHSWLETTVTYKMAFFSNFHAPFSKINITYGGQSTTKLNIEFWCLVLNFDIKYCNDKKRGS